MPAILSVFGWPAPAAIPAMSWPPAIAAGLSPPPAPIAMPEEAPPVSLARISLGSVKLKSWKMTVTSWASARASSAVRTISGAAISDCSWRPTWECIQWVPGVGA